MLHVFRSKGLSSVVYGGVIATMIVGLVFMFRPNAQQKSASLTEQCDAVVRGYCIDPKEHRATYNLLMPRDPQGGGPSPERARQMHLLKLSLDGLVERELLIGEADRLHLKSTDDEVTESLFHGIVRVSVPSDRPGLAQSLGVFDGIRYPQLDYRDPKTKQFTDAQYKRVIKTISGRSPVEFREKQQRELLAAKVRDLVRAPVRVNENEALERYVGEKTSASLTFSAVRPSWIARYMDAKQADVDAWGKDPANVGTIDAEVKKRTEPHVRHVLARAKADAKPEEKAAAHDKAAKALARIKAGEPIADVAKQMSEDPGSGAKGGDLGTDMEHMVDPFKKVATALKPGELAPELVETQFGYHVIKRDPAPPAAELEKTRRVVIRELYTKAKSLEATKAAADQIAAALKAGKTMEDAVAAVVQPIATRVAKPETDDTTEDAAKHDAPGADAGAGDGGATPPKTAGDDPERPQAEYAQATKSGDPIPAFNPEQTRKVLDFATSGKPGDVYGEIVRTDDAFYVVQLKDLKKATKDDFAKEKDAYMASLLEEKRGEALAAYVSRLREASKETVKIDEKSIRDETDKDGGAAAPVDEDIDEGQ